MNFNKSAENGCFATIPIDIWASCNIHTDNFVDRLEGLTAEGVQIALVGIHLCKGLSPRFLSVCNLLGTDKCPFFCLAPCCLPRLTQESINVFLYETNEERQVRQESLQRRKRARQRICWICSDPSHQTKLCPLLPTETEERAKTLSDHIVCWRCGEYGHDKVKCSSDQSSTRPQLIKAPAVSIPVEVIQQSPSPFDEYCKQLMMTISVQDTSQKESHVVTLAGNDERHDTRNKIGQRKCTWLLRFN
uniref:CCHC-type domain-containing protein n=1 Tax=Fibrocapsa japonica TaxID=94617 RepID=A0A7S2Y0C6_9STRA